MRLLLLKPRPEAVEFGLAPFFQTEPLGLEYVAAAAQKAGHSVQTADLRFERAGIRAILAQSSPQVVGISCLHVLDVYPILKLARQVKEYDRSIFVVVGGHAASAFPEAFDGSDSIDALCIGEGEQAFPALLAALSQHAPLSGLPFLMLPDDHAVFRSNGGKQELIDLRASIVPDRRQVQKYEKHYCCLNYMPVWTMETCRGCIHRCKFCSVWQLYKGACRFHDPASVRQDFETIGKNVFVIDDLFWVDEEQSSELASALLASRERKNWMLVQSRLDFVSESAPLLERWRPLANQFDIFFGFESPTSAGLKELNKALDVDKVVNGIETARRLGFGVTGNFIIDPDYSEDDFRELWAFLEKHQLWRVGFTILTPLPGTHYFNSMRDQLKVFDWNQYDLHHLLVQPRLPVKRFFELYCECWRRSVLRLGSQKKWWTWLTGVSLLDVPRLSRILFRTQKLMDPEAYLAETLLR